MEVLFMSTNSKKEYDHKQINDLHTPSPYWGGAYFFFYIFIFI